MRLSVWVPRGIVVAALVVFIWTFVDERNATPALRNDHPIEQPLERAESTPPRAGTRARATRNAGGLPARGAPAGRRSSSGPATPATTQPSVALPAAPAESTSAAPGTRGSVRRESATAPPPLEPVNQQAAVADAAAPAEDDRPRPRGIGGSVLEKNGTPAAGVPIGLKARRVFNGTSSSPLRATTDGRGNFAFGEVPDGEYEVYTEKNDRYDRASTLVRAGADAVVLIVEAIADALLSIRGVVESAGGGALEGVRVQAIGQANVVATTDSKGAYVLRIPAGAKAEQAALQFRRPGYRDRRWTMAEGLRSNDHEVVANVRLDPDSARVPVNGTVISTAGAPVARARVEFTSANRGRSYRAVTDDSGRFTIANVETGTDYRVWARAQSGFKDRVLENVIVDAGATAIDVELTPSGVATLRGRMVTPDGAAVPGFSLFLTAASGAGPRSLAVTGDAQGRFVVADLPEGRVALQTRAAPAISVSGIEVSAARPETDVTVVVDVGAHRFEGRLITRDGEPAAGATVSLEWSASSGGVTSQSSRRTLTDADGNFAFTQLGGGVHVVSAVVAGAGSVRLEHAITAGMEPLHITLPGKRGRQ